MYANPKYPDDWKVPHTYRWQDKTIIYLGSYTTLYIDFFLKKFKSTIFYVNLLIYYTIQNKLLQLAIVTYAQADT